MPQLTSDAAHEFLRSLNANQRAAAVHITGPLLVIAGAGTGKTKTLASRVAALIQSGADPGRILLLTFTRRAAREMIHRAAVVVGEAVARQVWGGTFHATANRLLHMHSQQLGLSQSFVLMDQGDAQDVFNLLRTELGLHKSENRFPKKGTLLDIYSRCINTSEPLEQVLTERFPWCRESAQGIKQIFQAYGDRKSARNLLDYDDLLLFWDQALDMPDAGAAIAARFDHVLVDEYQDTNPLQSALLRKMWGLMNGPTRNDTGREATARSIMAVGDDAQAIYSFRGSTIENIMRFPEAFPGATTITLEQNYRSVTPILEASNAVMDSAKRRFTKNLWSDRPSLNKPFLITCADEVAQSSFVADRILEHREEGVPLIKQAVLFRASHNSDALEVELGRRNIPFVKYGGLRFLEAAHIKDLLAFLRILENPLDDLSWMRLLQMLDGIGPGRAHDAVEHLLGSQGNPLALFDWKAPAAATCQVHGLASLLVKLVDVDQAMSLPTQIEHIRKFYTPLFEKHYDNPEMRLRDLDQLELLAQQAPDRATFLADLTLDPPVSTGDLSRDPLLDDEYTILSTIHSAKGCEWDIVYVIHAADGVMPSDMVQGDAEIEEERRLLYVAMTRARERLYVTFPLRYYHRKNPHGDAYSTSQLSRFLPPKIFPLFERRSFAPAEQGAQTPTPTGSDVATGVRDRIRKLWD